MEEANRGEREVGHSYSDKKNEREAMKEGDGEGDITVSTRIVCGHIEIFIPKLDLVGCVQPQFFQNITSA